MSTHRFYENMYPEVDDLVMIKVKSVDEMGAYVSLLEYGNIEGMILLSELSRSRIRSISKLVRVGRQEVVVVLRVDKEKGYIDLSKRRVTPEDIVKCEDKYMKSRAVHSIMRHCAEISEMELDDLYVNVAWPLYKKFGHAFEAFRAALVEPDTVFEGLNVETKIRDTLLDIIQKRMKPQPVKLRADLEVTCFGYEGIDAIKEALFQGENCGDDDTPIQIRLVAPPLYVMSMTTLYKGNGIETLNKAIDTVSNVLSDKNGAVKVKAAPRTVSEGDENALSNFMNKLRYTRAEEQSDSEEEESDRE
eukprot:gb/GECH01012441.1/.p1 GENE.gb/GECH01012441.1/~~gb/GECH01012441.1/.p1  ORF type:complete len:304 (+),score=64.24 gb/GECH01012441.1/:1-912(+)